MKRRRKNGLPRTHLHPPPVCSLRPSSGLLLLLDKKSKAWNTCGHFTAVTGLFPLSPLSIYHSLPLFSWEEQVMLSMFLSIEKYIPHLRKHKKRRQPSLFKLFFFHLDFSRWAIPSQQFNHLSCQYKNKSECNVFSVKHKAQAAVSQWTLSAMPLLSLKPRAARWSTSKLSGSGFLHIPVSRQSMAIEPEQGSIEFPTAAILLHNTAKITLPLNHYINANVSNAWCSYAGFCYISLMIWVLQRGQRNHLVGNSQNTFLLVNTALDNFIIRAEIWFLRKVQGFICSTVWAWNTLHAQISIYPCCNYTFPVH